MAHVRRLHPATNEDGSAYQSTHFNDCACDCGKFIADMQSYLMKEIITPINDIIVPNLGGLTQNASESVSARWRSATPSG